MTTCETIEKAKAQSISEFIQQVTGAEVTNQLLGTGKIVSCMNINNNFESLVFTVHFDLDETKNYGAAIALASGSLKFIDTSLDNIWDDFVVEQYKLKAEYNNAVEEVRCREKEAQKLEKKRKENEKKMAGMKAQAEKELNGLIENREKKITKADEFYYSLGWLATHVGTIVAKMPDYLEESFVKHFGDVKRTIVDSTKVGPAGYTSQWRLSMEASLKKVESIPATLSEYLSQNGKKVSKTSFVWSLVDDFGFKFGKEQDVVEIRKLVPDKYVDVFVEGCKA